MGSRRPSVRVEVTPAARPGTNVDTGFPVLDHLLGLLAEYGRFDLVVASLPGDRRPTPSPPAARSARPLPAAPRRGARVRLRRPAGGRGARACRPRGLRRPLAGLERRPLRGRVGGLGDRLVTGFLRRLAEGAGAHAARPPDRRGRRPARPRGDVQGARRRTDARLPPPAPPPREQRGETVAEKKWSAPRRRPRRSRAPRTRRRSRPAGSCSSPASSP